MGKRGPKVAGTKVKQPEPAGYLEADHDLSKEAKAVWNQTVRSMDPGFYSEMDRGLLRVYSRLYVSYDQAQTVVEREGVVKRTQLGDWIENPWYRAMLKAAEALARLAVKLKACKSATVTSWATGKASRVGKPETKSPRAGLMYGETDQAPADRLN